VKKEMLSKMKMPEKGKKDPMLDLDAALKDIGSEKGDSEMNGMEESEEGSEYGYAPEMEVGVAGGEGMEGESEMPDFSQFTDEELQAELDKRKKAGSKKPMV